MHSWSLHDFFTIAIQFFTVPYSFLTNALVDCHITMTHAPSWIFLQVNLR